MRVRRFFMLAAALACTAFAQNAVAVETNLLSDATFSKGVGQTESAWLTFTQTDGTTVPTFGTTTAGEAFIAKNDAAREDCWSGGVIYQAVNVAAGTKVKLTGNWSGSLGGAGGPWWTEVSLFSLPSQYSLDAVPTNYGFVNDTNYHVSRGNYTFLEACFDYPGNFASFGASGGEYAATTDYLHTSTGPKWTNQSISSSAYDWKKAKAAFEGAGNTWATLERQEFDGQNTITSNGTVVVALKFGSEFGNDGSVSFGNLSLSTVPEPSSIALVIACVLSVFAYAWRKRKQLR